jgi:hypothetical protein
VTLNANILFSLVANETDAGDYAKDVRTTKVEDFIEFTDGTGARQAQVVWSNKGTVSPSQNLLLNPLQGMSGLADERGSVNLSSIKAVFFKNAGSVTVVISFQDFLSGPPFGLGEVSLKEGASAFFYDVSADGVATAGGSLYVSNSSSLSSAAYEIVLIGEGTIT